MFEIAAPIQSPTKCKVQIVVSHHSQSVFKTTIHEAVTEKLCAHWVPKLLMDYHKTKRMVYTPKFLMRYAQEGDEFLGSIVTGDETWGFHHAPESKQQSRSRDMIQRAGGRLL
jgi:hypothetical protein